MEKNDEIFTIFSHKSMLSWWRKRDCSLSGINVNQPYHQKLLELCIESRNENILDYMENEELNQIGKLGR